MKCRNSMPQVIVDSVINLINEFEGEAADFCLHITDD